MIPFDPKNNEDDKLLLTDIVQGAIRKFAEKSMNSGTVKIGSKDYHFKGLNAWVEVYIKWFERKKKELNDKIDGYNKADRWDGVGRIIIAYTKLIEADKESKWRTLIDDIIKVMMEPDKVQLNPSEVTAELNTIYETIQKEVFEKLFEEKVDLSDVPSVWDGFIRHISSQQASATNFYLVSQEVSTNIYEVGQQMKESRQASS